MKKEIKKNSFVVCKNKKHFLDVVRMFIRDGFKTNLNYENFPITNNGIIVFSDNTREIFFCPNSPERIKGLNIKGFKEIEI